MISCYLSISFIFIANVSVPKHILHKIYTLVINKYEIIIVKLHGNNRLRVFETEFAFRAK